jgi:hypothetical protein
MPITENDALEKWCHTSFSGVRAKCLGSGCMAWRWAESIPHVCTKCGADDTTWEDQPELRKGYCGLAGTPKW